jgi:hypothetical protein
MPLPVTESFAMTAEPRGIYALYFDITAGPPSSANTESPKTGAIMEFVLAFDKYKF